jgi:hypothetical protein
VVWSKTSVDSKWVQEEADSGLERNILIPIFIDNVKPPLGFRNIQAADLINWEPTQSSTEFEKLIDDISAILGPSSMEVKGAARIEDKERRRKQEEKRQRREDEHQREEAKRKTEEQTLHKTEEPSQKIRGQPHIKPQERKIPSNKSTTLASKLLPIAIVSIVGLILAIIASAIRGFQDFAVMALIGVCGWAVIGAIFGKDRRAVIFLLAGYFLGAIIWKSFDFGFYPYARAIFFGGGCGALIGSILGRILSKFKEKT